jgi:protein-tyrosine phosphatase
MSKDIIEFYIFLIKIKMCEIPKRSEKNLIKYSQDSLYIYIQTIVKLNTDKAYKKTKYYTVNNEIASISHIFGRFYIGNGTAALNIQILKENGIKNVLNCASNDVKVLENEYSKYDIIYDHVPAKDSENFDYKILDYFKKSCFSFIHNTKGPILINCVAGEIRSVTIFIAYLMEHLGIKFMDALDLVSSSRPNILYNPSYCHQLNDYALQLNLL